MNQREYQALILAGLLHDVGKLLVKDPEERTHAKQLTRTASGQGSAAHWLLGEDYLRRDGIAEGFARLNVDLDLVCFAVRWHHLWYQREVADRALVEAGERAPSFARIRDCIIEADGLSASERSKRAGEPIDYALALQSIFANLTIGRPRGDASLRYLPAVLTPEAAFPATFPLGNNAEAQAYREEAYAPLVRQFDAGFRHALAHAQTGTELEAWIYALLERYAWAIPSDMHARAEPRDVSLFDHERTTCALAAAVYLWQELAPEDKRDKPSFLFVKGDVSGVQDYIYSVANVGPGGVAKRLRARSFFVTALTETVAHRLREELVPGYPLPIAAQILAGGGQFVLLAPDLPAVHERLRAVEREVNAWLWRELQGDLAFVFAAVSATGAEVGLRAKRTVCDVLDDLDHEVAAAKSHRLGILLQAKNEQGEKEWVESAFKWEVAAYPHGDCPSCGRLPARAGENAPLDSQLCTRCHQDRILSEQIVAAQYIAYFKGPRPTATEGDGAWLERSTLDLFEGEATRHVVLLAAKGGLDRLDRLDRPPYQLDGFGYGSAAGQEAALVRHFANHVPRFDSLRDLALFCSPGRNCLQGRYTDDDNCGIMVRPDGSGVGGGSFPILQTFGCISASAAEWPDGSLGSQLLGVLRADVDHLGRLFRHGLGEVKSLSRVATLSRMTDLFFSGWVHSALEKDPAGKGYDRIYTVYSGGDDLCLVGPWDVIVDFSHHLAVEFARYAAGNPNVTLSAAIAVTKPKLPIATSARLAGEWLEQRAKGQGRNRLHLFGVTVRWRDLPDWENLDPDLKAQLDALEAHARLCWDDLWPWAGLFDEELRRWREASQGGYPLSTGFAHRLLDYAERARRWEEAEEIAVEDMLYLAHLAYDLGRNVLKSDAVPGSTKARMGELTQLANREVMAGLRLPLTYALYRNRERSRER